MTNNQSILTALVIIVVAALIAVGCNPSIATVLPALSFGVVIGGLLAALNTAHTGPAADPNVPGSGPSK